MGKSEERKNKPSLPDVPDRMTTDDAKTPGGGNVNPFDQGRRGSTGGTGGVNPSGPTTGTEGWGLGRNEPTNGTGQGELGTLGAGHQSFASERDSVPLGQRTFRCADAGNADCRWETSAQTEDDLMGQIERHGREVHGITNFDDARRRKILDVVRERRAA